MAKKISVIIPVFNMEKFIEEAVLSAINQEGFTREDIEVIVINDGSRDKTESIVGELIKKHGDFIKCISLKENSGVLTATIEGLTIAAGEYICLLDADDVWRSTKLSQVVSCFADGYDLVFHEGEFIDMNGYPLNKPVRCMTADDKIADNIMTFNGGVPLGSAISFRRTKLDMGLLCSVYNSYKVKNTERFVAQDSAILHALIAKNNIRTKCVSKILYGYRMHDDSSDSSALKADFDNNEKLRKTFNVGLYTTLFAIEIYKKSGLYYKDKRIEIGFKKFLYCKNFSLKEKSLFTLYSDYYFLLKNNAFTDRKEKITRFIYPLFFKLPVELRMFIRQVIH